MGLFLGSRETRAIGWISEPPIPAFPGSDVGGYVNTTTKPDVALQVPTVWACVSLLAGTVSSLKIETFRRSTDPVAIPERLSDPKLVTTPDGRTPQSAWLHQLMVSLLLRGNAFGRVTRDPRTLQPTAVTLLNPDAVRVDIDQATGTVTYKWVRTGAEIPSADIWHLPGLTLPGSPVGLSPISYAAAVLGLDISSRNFASGFFDGGGIPKAVITSDQQVNQEQARTIKDRIMASFRGRDPLVLGLGLGYQQISVHPEESQFLATQQANVNQICRYFGVPAAMVDGPAGGGMNYTNTEQRGIEFLNYSLAPWLKRIEDGMFSLLPGTQYVKFEVKDLLRLDAHTQSQVDLLDLAGKIIAPSEIRARRGLPPMTDAQKEEANMVPLHTGPLGRPVGDPALKLNPGAEAPVPATENPSGV